MIKIFLTCRNRLAITKKCIHALKIHSLIPHQIYVYDNSSNYLLDQHFAYFYKAYEKGYINQITFTTNKTTFNAFSKATTCNMFGAQHEFDPLKNKYIYLVMIDNDVIVTPEWDKKLLEAWKYVYKNEMNDIKIVGQLPGGIKERGPEFKINDMSAQIGKLGGSGLWSIRSDFFRDIGYIDLNKLIGLNKKHDSTYWEMIETKTRGNKYILGLNEKIGIHVGKLCGSICNTLTRNNNSKQKDELIKFKEAEDRISNMTFDDFYKMIINDNSLLNDW